MSAMESRRFALAHLTFERNAIMATEQNNGIEDAQKLLAPLGWRWIAASLEPRREFDPKHADTVERLELFQTAVGDLIRSYYMGGEPTDDEWTDIEPEATWFLRLVEGGDDE